MLLEALQFRRLKLLEVTLVAYSCSEFHIAVMTLVFALSEMNHLEGEEKR